MSTILYFIVALLLLALFIFVHELGHFLAARATGIGVKEFSLGFGPKLWGRLGKTGTQYALRIIPMGGYCAFYGEDGEESDREDAYRRQKVWKRMIATVAGPLMNVALAYVAMVILMLAVETILMVPMIYQVTSGSSAEAAGLQAGDVVVSVDGTEISYDTQGIDDLRALVQEAVPQDLSLVVQRDGQLLTRQVTPQQAQDGSWLIGITLGESYYRSLGAALTDGGRALSQVAVDIVGILGRILSTGEGVEDTTGVVGTVTLMAQTVQQGFVMVLYMVAVISLNLGIFNLLPLPALDGGHLLLQVIEVIRRKPMKPQHEIWIQSAGFLLIIGIFVLTTYQDIVRLISR